MNKIKESNQTDRSVKPSSIGIVDASDLSEAKSGIVDLNYLLSSKTRNRISKIIGLETPYVDYFGV